MNTPLPFEDAIGAWVPHGRFCLPPSGQGPLNGLRFAAKDLFDVAGHVTGAGNPDWLATHTPASRHSPVVAQLLDAGAMLAGKTITDELAYSIHGDNAHYGAPLNSRAPGRVTGGSSSGSAAAVAAGLVDFALGTDTGGSTRVPASYCGIWGLRTTHGRVSAAGLAPLSPAFDTVTWLASDPQVFLRVGATLLADEAPRRFERALVLLDACAEAEAGFQPLIERVALALSEEMPVTQARASAEPLEQWRSTYITASAFDAWRTHGEWITRAKPVFGAAVQGRWQAASQVSPEAAGQAQTRQAALRAELRALLGENGVAILPSASSPAIARDADAPFVDQVRAATFRITSLAGLAGLPQVSIPLVDAEGLPAGVSLMGPAGSDLALIELAVRVAQRLQAPVAQ